ARGEPAAVAELDRLAAAARAPGAGNAAVGYRDDRRAVAGAEIHARMHALVAEDRMAAHAEVGRDPAGHRRDEAAALLAHAGCLVEAALVAPAHKLGLRLPAPLDPGIEQLPRLALAGGGAAVLHDHVERVGRAHRSVEIDLFAERLQVLLHRARGSARSAHRAVEATADGAADAQRRLVDADRLARERQMPGIVARHGQREAEAGAEFER